MRIVSLIPSATEIVCALGFEDSLVGRSHECDFPESVRQLPVCTKPAFNPEGSSREIDERVKDLLEKALSIYDVNTKLFQELDPDVIVTQAQCEVCAVSLKDVEVAVSKWTRKSPKIVSLVPNSLKDVFADIERVAVALGEPARGSDLVSRLKGRMAGIVERVASLPSRPKVACIEWIDPLMAAGNWMPELVVMAGGTNLFGEAGKHSPWMKREELWQSDPDIIVVLPCGFDMERSNVELAALSQLPEWKDLKAVQGGKVFITDGNQYFNRPGPRLVESLEILAEIIHPNAFHFGFEGKGWEKSL